MSEYEGLLGAITPRGMRGYFQGPHQLVISRQVGPAWPNRGNSFWMCRMRGAWYVATWTPRYYRLPDDSKVAEFCEEFVDVGDGAQYAVPAELASRYQMAEVDGDEFDRSYATLR